MLSPSNGIEIPLFSCHIDPNAFERSTFDAVLLEGRTITAYQDIALRSSDAPTNNASQRSYFLTESRNQQSIHFPRGAPMKIFNKLLSLCLGIVLLTAVSVGQTSKEYKVIDKVKIGGEGGWDYLIADGAAHRLYMSHATVVVVFDTKTNKVVGEIPNTLGVHGIALAPDLGRGYTSNGRTNSVTVFDLKSLKVLDTIDVKATNPDAILYDPFSHRVFTFNGRSSNATAINANTNKFIDTIPLGGRPEFAVTDLKGKIYVNIEDKSQVIEFDAKTLKVLSTWPIAPGEEASGLAIDRKHNRLFSVCSNKMMVVLDSKTGKVVASVPTGDGTDAAAFDPETQLAFSSNGDGTLTVIHEDSPDKFTVVQNAVTPARCRTMALDELTHRLYLSGATFGPTPAPTADRPRPRAPMEPGSFMVVVLDRQ
jgi:YVTN family beta-propeller protein